MLTDCAVFSSVAPISSATDMNRLLKISSRTGSTATSPGVVRALERHGALEQKMASRLAPGPPSGLHDERAVGLDDKRRTVETHARGKTVAIDDRRVEEAIAILHRGERMNPRMAHPLRPRGDRGPARRQRIGRGRSARHDLDEDRLHDERPPCLMKSESLRVRLFEIAARSRRARRRR